ncbi:MAG TPA: GNAT family N-acetyltransferase [Planosporangium sp.]|jgi:GNAT superfamily N-acetyltransferase|nr:GNAT family N-acetyltransferase [Planosporangium sp.]
MTTAPPETKIRRATPDDAPHATTTLVEGFLHGDLADWLIPDTDARRAAYGPYFRIFVEHALAHGRIDVTEDLSAAAVWFTVVAGADRDSITDYDARLAAACGPWTARFSALDAALHHAHPTDQTHHYLAFLAVRPHCQGTGLGSALLRHYHAELDVSDVPAYLEATGRRNGALYARHGYEAREPITVPDGPPLYAMWRPPRRRTTGPGPEPS